MIAARQAQRYRPRDFNYGSRTATERERKPERRGFLGSSVDPVDWRESNDYRQDYLRRNRGIGGYLYVCSQCFKPMFGKDRIQVDHIIPPSKFATKKRVRGHGGFFSTIGKAFGFGGGSKDKDSWVKTSVMSRFLNHSFNCAAICGPCNRKKSNKINLQIVRGYGMKAVEVTAAVAQFALSLPFVALSTALWVTGKLVGAGFRLATENTSTHKRRRR
jgi:5-methylcytosine-specific restriction endonuclease McrA